MVGLKHPKTRSSTEERQPQPLQTLTLSTESALAPLTNKLKTTTNSTTNCERVIDVMPPPTMNSNYTKDEDQFQEGAKGKADSNMAGLKLTGQSEPVNMAATLSTKETSSENRSKLSKEHQLPITEISTSTETPNNMEDNNEDEPQHFGQFIKLPNRSKHRRLNRSSRALKATRFSRKRVALERKKAMYSNIRDTMYERMREAEVELQAAEQNRDRLEAEGEQLDALMKSLMNRSNLSADALAAYRKCMQL